LEAASKFAALGVSIGMSFVASNLSRDFMVRTLVCEIASVDKVSCFRCHGYGATARLYDDVRASVTGGKDS
jgi:hypothetical protein